jgi:RsiW-degrading membrane proteinase PrsW (M82 family)
MSDDAVGMTGSARYAARVAPINPQAVPGDRRVGHTPIGFIVGVAACSLVALGALAVVAARGALPAGIGLTLALLPIPALLAGVLGLDRLEPEPPGSLVFIFLWGAGSAALIGLIGVLAGNQLLTTPALRAGGFATASATAVIGVAVLEDTLMGAALVGLLWLRPQEIDGISDGVVYGSMVGLGFALIENIFYYAQATHYGFSGVATTFVLRGVVSPVCQALFASLIGAGVAYAATVAKGRGLWAVGLGWVAAVTLHSLWNAALAGAGGRLALTYAVLAFIVILLLIAMVVDRRRIIVLIRRYLPEYEPAGILTALDVSMLSSMPRRRQARAWARLHGGLGALKDMAEYQLSATELGLLHHRSERGLVDSESFAQRRDWLVAGMQAATSAFVVRFAVPPRPPWATQGSSCFRPARGRPAPATSRPDSGPDAPAPRPDLPPDAGLQEP